MNTEKWLKQNTTSLSGKLVIVSGSTGGIGIHLCRYLVRLGARLILCDRNEEKIKALISSLKEENPKAEISYIKTDLADIENVKQTAEELLRLPIDYLILNAGAYSIPRNMCTSGYNNIFQINFISPYYLVRRLFDKITARNGRVIAVGSIAHNYSKADFSDIDFSRRKAASKLYGNAKRFLMFSLFGLFKGTECLSVVHPGITFTNITNHYPKLIFALIKHPMKLIFMKPKRAALCVLKGIFDKTKNNEWIGPWLFDIWGLPKKKPLNTCKSKEANRIFKEAEKIYNLL